MKIGKGSHQQIDKSENMAAAVLEGNEEYRAFIDKLTEANVDRHVQLPMIAVMGDTSSGKSSLLSFIAHVELPSSDRLTTRCPIRMQMSRNQTRSATVSVIWKDSIPGKSEADIHFKPREVNESTWHNLTGHIADAQKHIIKTTGKDVARDIVSIKVAGPQCEDLTLIDLPGIVRSTGKGESETLSQDVQSLIDDYLKNSRCVILAVHPVNVDFHNSQIMDEAKKVDPEAKRTLPVLTKPDIIDAGAEGSVKELLLGLKTVGFDRGFHMVKGRGQAALNRKDSIEQGLHDEQVFFRTTQPWRDMDDRSQFGTPVLRTKLGQLQMELVRSTLPNIIMEIKKGRDETAQKLQILGSAPSSGPERRQFFGELRDDFVHTLRSLLSGSVLRENGDETEATCSAKFFQESKKFMAALEAGRLATISKVSVGVQAVAVIGSTEVKGKVIDISGDNIYLDNHHSGAVVTNHGRSVGEVWSVCGQVRLASSTSQYLNLTPIPSEKVRRDPEWIRSMIEKHRPYKLPIFVNTDVFEQIVRECLEHDWRPPSLQLVEATRKILKSAVKGVLDDQKKLSSLPRLRDFLHFRIEGIVDDMIGECQEKVEEYIMEEKIPFSQNHYLNENIARSRSKRLEEALLEDLSLNAGTSYNGATLKSAIVGVFERNQKKSVDEHMGEDMQDALDAYGKVALKRAIDGVPMKCGKVLLDLPNAINQELNKITDVELEKCIRVSSEDQAKRANLTRKFEELDDGLKVIKELF